MAVYLVRFRRELYLDTTIEIALGKVKYLPPAPMLAGIVNWVKLTIW